MRHLLFPFAAAMLFIVQARATTINQADQFVNAVYLDLLNRPADASALAGFAVPIANGTLTDTQMAMDVLTSSEYRTDLVGSYYQSYLSRSPQPLETTAWLNFFSASGTDQGVQSNILGANEFFQDQGATNAGFVTGAYGDLLNRTPGSSEQAVWVNLLNSASLTRAQVAAGILGSVEYDDDLVTSYYSLFLDRTPGSGELNTWASDIQGGATNEQVIASILGSQEFFSLTQQSATPEPATFFIAAAALSLGFLLRRRRLGTLK